MKQDGIKTSIFPAATMYYTQYKGKRCALPLLADVYGFYYNKAMFAAAGLTSPPKTLARADDVREEADDEERGRLAEGRRLQPVLRLLPEHVGRLSAARERASGSTRAASPSLGKDPAWPKLLRWQKSLVDYYGHKNLVKWNAGAGDEFSASHAFETGKLAMMIDGEWRVAFIAAEHPELKYGTAPMPVDAAQLGLYGSGYINGTIIGIPKNAKNKDASWALVKYLTTNDHALAQFSNGIRNVPSTKSRGQVEGAEAGRELRRRSRRSSRTRSRRRRRSRRPGSAYLDTFANFLAKWQAGKVSNLQKGLQDVDKQIDAKLKQSGRRAAARRDRLRRQPGRTPPPRRPRRSTAGGPSGGRHGAAAAWSSPS